MSTIFDLHSFQFCLPKYGYVLHSSTGSLNDISRMKETNSKATIYSRQVNVNIKPERPIQSRCDMDMTLLRLIPLAIGVSRASL